LDESASSALAFSAQLAATAMARIFDAELGPGWEGRVESKSRADTLLVQLLATWREQGLPGLVARAGVSSVTSLLVGSLSMASLSVEQPG
ncbi:MAG: hypothetical protein D6773_04105, partial [Alphaproteobacteria bacterium]